jgi:4-hydroxy-2-oxoglutarate aldolase
VHLSGIVPPIPTPFTRDGDLDLTALQGLIGHLEPQVDGFLILGSNGEAAYLSDGERREVLAVARKAIPAAKPMIAGTGGESTREAIERTRLAADAGADLALVLAPHYYRGAMTAQVLEAHYRAVAEASPIPVLVYNIPQVTGISHAPDWLARIAAHPSIVGVKDSSGDILTLTETMRQVPDGFTVMSGHAPTFLAALAVGAGGGILAAANVLPDAYRALLRAFHAGDLVEARRLQFETNELANAVTRDHGVTGLKATLRGLGLPGGYPRAPLQDVSKEVAARLDALARAGLDLN